MNEEDRTVHVQTRIEDEAAPTPCDIDDIHCQNMVMSHLQALEQLLGTDAAQKRYPEHKDWKKVVQERIEIQNTAIKDAYERCGIPPPPPEVIAPGDTE